MTFVKFEDIIAWQKAQDLCVEVYLVFQNTNDFGFKNQIQKASLSISNNIAEGYDRMSDKEFVKFLYIALGSCSEVKSMLYLSNRLNYITKIQSEELINKSNEVGKIIRGLIKSISPTTNN